MAETPPKQNDHDPMMESGAGTPPRPWRAGFPAEPPRTPAPLDQSPPAVGRLMSRSLALAVGRGLLGRCPNCGKGAMYRSYLAVNPRCPSCGEDLSAQRADDAPAFLTLLVVCFVGGAGALFSEDDWPQMPLLAVVLLWLFVIAVASLLILPRVKGAVVGYQWAMRMHGFGAAKGSPERESIDPRRR